MHRLPLSLANTNRLEQLGPEAISMSAGDGEGADAQHSLNEAAQRLSRAGDEKSRHDAALQLFTALSAAVGKVQVVPLGLIHSLAAALRLDDALSDYAVHALTAEVALAALELLSTEWLCRFDDQVLVSVVAYTNVHDPWTTPESLRLAASLVASQLPAEKLAEFIPGPLLQNYLRPIFSGASDKVTSSGRPDQFRGRPAAFPTSQEIPHWKRGDPAAVSVFHWAVDNAPISLIAESWPLFLPVLLATVEDQEIASKEKGLGILTTFIRKCPPETLHLTGMGNLFEDAIFPALLLLPSLTPERDSAKLLRLACQALLQLAKADLDAQGHTRRRLLDRLIRDGIMVGYFHASQHAMVVEALMQNAAAAVSCLGIYSVKHLQNLLDIIESAMTDPFAMAHPPIVVAAADALDAILSHCWPRIPETKHAGRILRVITACWLNICDQNEAAEVAPTQDLARICERLIASSRSLQSIWPEGSPEMQHTLAKALSRESRLAPLFPGHVIPQPTGA